MVLAWAINALEVRKLVFAFLDALLVFALDALGTVCDSSLGLTGWQIACRAAAAYFFMSGGSPAPLC